MAIDWQAVIVALGGQAVLLAAVAYLCKALISNQLSKDIEAFKAQLQISATEHQIRFSKLHDRRALVIEKLYRLLLKAADAAKFFAAQPSVEGSNYKKEAIDRHRELYSFLQINKIYLPSAVCGLLENYERKIRFLVGSIDVYMSVENPKPEVIEMQTKVLQEAWQALEKEIPAIRTELDTEFRQMLGVESGSKK